jgi:uncharacterized protein with HEPN domain
MSAPTERIRLEHMLDAARWILSETAGRDISCLTDDLKTRLAIFMQLQIIGEAANHLSQALLTKYPQVPWRQVVNFRNIIAHEYFGVDYETVWTTIFKDLPPLTGVLQQMIADLSAEK